MPEHLIRLRGPWELLVETTSGTEAIRFDLPADLLPGSDRPLRLLRRFGRPARSRPGMPCSLRAEDVPGLLRLALNGVPLAFDPAADGARTGPIELPVGPRLLARNVLELSVAPGPPRQGEDGRPWGAIALVFGPEADSAG